MAHGGRGLGRFVVARLALALTLLTAGGLLLRSFSSLLATSPGFTPEGVAAVQVFARLADRTPGERAAVFQQIVDGMRTLPHVQEAGAASVIPFLDTTGSSSVAITIDGRPPVAGAEEPSAFVNVATPGYFPALRVPLLDGRAFDEHDGPRAIAGRGGLTDVCGYALARQLAGGTAHSFHDPGAKISAEIIGVVGDVRHDALDRPASQEIFVPHAQLPITDMTFVARTSRRSLDGHPGNELEIRGGAADAGGLSHRDPAGSRQPLSQRPAVHADARAMRLPYWRQLSPRAVSMA